MDDREAPNTGGDVVGGVHDVVRKGQPTRWHGGDDRHQEQIDHLPGNRQTKLRERTQDRKPHQQS